DRRADLGGTARLHRDTCRTALCARARDRRADVQRGVRPIRLGIPRLDVPARRAHPHPGGWGDVRSIVMTFIPAIVSRGVAARLLTAALGAPAPAHAQATSTPAQTAAPTTSTVSTPRPTALTQTCLFGCSSQFTACQNTCLASVATGTTVIPS